MELRRIPFVLPRRKLVLTAGPLIRQIKGVGPINREGLPVSPFADWGLGFLIWLWKHPHVGMCAVNPDELVDFARQYGFDESYCTGLQRAFNFTIKPPWLDRVVGLKGWFTPGPMALSERNII